MPHFYKVVFVAVLLLPSVECEVATTADCGDFKACAPEYYKDVKNRSFGSLFHLFKGTNRESLDNKTEKVEQPNQGQEESKKEKAWKASLAAVNKSALSYVNKSHGIIKTDETYIPEFDGTNTYKYRIIINISDSGDITVNIKSKEDSKTRIVKHEKNLKLKIIANIKN